MCYYHPNLELLECLNGKWPTNGEVIFIRLNGLDDHSESTLLTKEGEVESDKKGKSELQEEDVVVIDQEDAPYSPRHNLMVRPLMAKPQPRAPASRLTLAYKGGRLWARWPHEAMSSVNARHLWDRWLRAYTAAPSHGQRRPPTKSSIVDA
ncbi:hypothetical protein BHE74_00042739 [Ensete ventricosum]|nr:hypothetical protein BHE74_00042739 [Ensete ventricosum]